jgi:hypothetical protein
VIESRNKLPAKVAKLDAGLGAVGAAEIGGGLKNKEIKERQAQKEAKDEMSVKLGGKKLKMIGRLKSPPKKT